MLSKYFRETFLEPLGERWFGLGLIIESTSATVADHAFARLTEALPNIRFDLLSKTERPRSGFRHIFRVKHPLGGLRLLLKARKEYDLVIFFAGGEGQLRLCRALALLLMRPKRFFVWNEFGDGFWLNRENWVQVRMHLEMRYHWQKRWESFVAALLLLKRCLVWLARLPVRIAQAFCAGLLLLPALLLLAILRVTYDTRNYRFRIFAKTTAAPSRKLSELEAPPVLAGGPSEQTTRDSLPPR